jgi:8-hydroxy-5-deazaflavin:NADPH oxidoreductase
VASRLRRLAVGRRVVVLPRASPHRDTARAPVRIACSTVSFASRLFPIPGGPERHKRAPRPRASSATAARVRRAALATLRDCTQALTATAAPGNPDEPPGGALPRREPRGLQYRRGSMTTIGLIGAGHIGSQLARLAVKQAYDVVISNSRGPETLKDLVAELGPKARAATPAEAAKAGDLVVVTVPLKAYTSVPVAPLAGKIVVDTNNYYPGRDGHIRALDDESTTTAELLQAHLPKSHVVKAFNHIYAADLTTHGQTAGTANRRALVIAGDDAGAKATVAKLIDQFGFDAVDAGRLAEGWRIQRDTPGYGPRRNAEELKKDLAAAKRYRDMA